MVLPFLAPFSGWAAVSSLGQAQTLLPLAVAFGALLAWRARAGAVAVSWLLWLGAAAALVVATKVAFMGWGIGIERFDFTGVSGHAMCAAAVYPLLFYICATRYPSAWRWAAMVLGCGVALVVAYSRVRVQAHSPSEAVTGWLLGSAVSWWALRRGRGVRAHIPLLAVALAVVWVMPFRLRGSEPRAPHWTPDDAIIWVALQASGRSTPYTRDDLHGRASARRSTADVSTRLAHHAV